MGLILLLVITRFDFKMVIFWYLKICVSKSHYLFVAGFRWKFVPSKFTPPPKEFRIYGNVLRQTVIDNFVVSLKRENSNEK